MTFFKVYGSQIEEILLSYAYKANIDLDSSIIAALKHCPSLTYILLPATSRWFNATPILETFRVDDKNCRTHFDVWSHAGENVNDTLLREDGTLRRNVRIIDSASRPSSYKHQLSSLLQTSSSFRKSLRDLR